ncbi:cytochrome c3 family protein [Aestuariirhabdus litorea]|nr:cytochrome c3 family protein [Aestuariirhabdus litorea]
MSNRGMSHIVKAASLPLLLLLWGANAVAAPSPNMPRSADISSTKHNLSNAYPEATDPREVKATGESQICAFCHTPHGANLNAEGPLWNRNLSNETYITYDSSSMQANVDANPGGASKLCLSCHDGTLAIGNVNVLEGNTNVSISMSGTGAGGVMPSGLGLNTGFTRNLGTDLRNDHPISFDFDSSKVGGRLAAADGELRDPQDADGTHIRTPDPKSSDPSVRHPLTPLDKNGKVQCTSCHDPHVSGQDLPAGTSIAATEDPNNIKFLRTRRYQMNAPVGGDFDEDNDIVCLACHDKLGQTWANSVHAANTADDQYRIWSADMRDFPRDLRVWQAACLNCHDTHTVEGSRRLLREGTDDTPAAQQAKQGGNPALEETCYQCHRADDNTNALKVGTTAPNIKDEFELSNRAMPIRSSQQAAGVETHDITNADFFEGDVDLDASGEDSNGNLALGYGNLNNRHVECTDCHNPHRMLSNSKWDGGGTPGQGTHEHTDSTNHTNEISGVLYGTWGVEPVYNSGPNGRKFGTPDAMPIRFKIKYGTGNERVTAEYQICLKCHSNYAYQDDGYPESPTRPALGAPGTPSTGTPGTRAATTDFLYYTNQAMEFQAPSTHQGQVSNGTDAGATFNTNNHRSWHPVMAPTGRTPLTRGANRLNWRAPWDNNVGNQTMYCTDCHGASNGTTENSTPGTKPWGPHGSNNDFILRGVMKRGIGQDLTTVGGRGLCFKCHYEGQYRGSGTEGLGGSSGFGSSLGCSNDGVGSACDKDPGGNGHTFHASAVEVDMVCTWCHVAVVHGWKNKAFLVNLEDIGPEAICRSIDRNIYGVRGPSGLCTIGQPIEAGSRVSIRPGGFNNNEGYNNPPYYVNARLRLQGFARSGRWGEGHCYDKPTMEDTMCARRNAGY